MIWEFIREFGRSVKKFLCPYVVHGNDEWYCKKQKSRFGGYHECSGYCPKKIRGDNNG